jgi:hypothetical protein
MWPTEYAPARKHSAATATVALIPMVLRPDAMTIPFFTISVLTDFLQRTIVPAATTPFY